MADNKKLERDELENARVKYQGAISIHNSQGEIQWTRYSAMLVINTVLIGLLGFAYSSNFRFPFLLKLLFLLTPIFGIFLCNLWWKISNKGFFWIDHWLGQARELESYLSGGPNPIIRGKEKRDDSGEIGLTKKYSLKIIDLFKYIYIAILSATLISIFLNNSINLYVVH